jgi:hypothetical protein
MTLDIHFEHGGPQQALWECPVHEAFFGGGRGGGKTFGMLVDWMLHERRYAADASGVFFRRKLPQLDEVIKLSHKFFLPLGARYTVQAKTWTFPSGATLKFRYLDREEDADEYQGHEYTWICFEELTQWATPAAINKLRACLRHPKVMPGFFRATGNPGGPGHNWVKARYVDPARRGYRIITDQETGLERVFIPSLLRDNIVLDQKQYTAQLKMVGADSLVRAWLEGDWDIVAGGFFDDIWSQKVHILKPFPLPSRWLFRRSFDWGSSRPASTGFWAESDGSQPEKAPFHFPRGTMIRVGEWYTVKRDRSGMVVPDVGQKLTNEALGAGIAERSVSRKFYGAEGRKWRGCVADPSIWNDHGDRSIYDGMKAGAEKAGWGISFDKADNDRVTGWSEMRAMLENALEKRAEFPGLYVFENCENWIRTVPVLQRDEKNGDDVDSESEDHAADETRYAVMYRVNHSKKKRLAG